MNAHSILRAAALLPLCTAAWAHAQPVITANGLFTIGSRYQVATDESPAVSPGGNGTGITWSFADLESDAFRILDVMAPASSPFGTQLSGNRAAVEDTDAAAEYMTVNPNQLLSHGRMFAEDGIQVRMALVPPMVLLNLPAQYGAVHSGISRSSSSSPFGFDPGVGFVVDSIRLRTRIEYQSELIGWGNVTTPMGTFSAMKQQFVQNLTDSVDFYRADQDLWVLGVDVAASADKSWSWWTPELAMPVLQLYDDENNGTMDRAYWVQADLSTTGIDGPAHPDRIGVYPNPATDRITVPLAGLGAATYTLCDAQGRQVQAGSLTQDRSAIPVAHLERGAYLLRIDQGGNISQARVVLQ